MSGSPGPQADIEVYLHDLTDVVLRHLGADLLGLYLHGSAVQGDLQPQTSDLDVLGVLARPLSDDQRAGLAADLAHERRPVPAMGLELILCLADQARAPAYDFRFEFALSTGASWSTESEPPGTSSDLVINVALCREDGRALTARTLFGPVPREALARALADELRWHQQHLDEEPGDPSGANAVLNAARSVYAARTGRVVSKTAGGLWWLDQRPQEELVLQALALRRGDRSGGLARPAVRAFLEHALREIG
jgi:hypothetical protein